jgi:hypothetical protein
MALPLSTARSIGKSRTKKDKVVSEFGGKASPVSKKTRNGATDRLRRKKGGR